MTMPLPNLIPIRQYNSCCHDDDGSHHQHYFLCGCLRLPYHPHHQQEDVVDNGKENKTNAIITCNEHQSSHYNQQSSFFCLPSKEENVSLLTICIVSDNAIQPCETLLQHVSTSCRKQQQEEKNED